MNTSMNFPPELMDTFTVYLDSPSKRNFSMASRYTHASVLRATRCLKVFPPKEEQSKAPEDILISVIRRYPNLEQIIFEGFKDYHSLYLKQLFSNLKKDPLCTIKKIKCQEIQRWGYTKDIAIELNSLFFSTISHKNLENIRIRTCYMSRIEKKEILPIFEKSLTLKTVVLNGVMVNFTDPLPFGNLTHLSKVKLISWGGSINSLKKCMQLEQLVLKYRCTCASNEVRAILSEDSLWKLKRLEISCITLRNDAELNAITKNHSSLECLDIDMLGISDKGMDQFGINCPNLRILKLRNIDLTDSGLDLLTKRLPDLEIFSIESGKKITEVAITAIAKNCKKLRFLEVYEFNKTFKIDALTKNCKGLRGVSFHTVNISLKDMDLLVEKLPNIRYVLLNNRANLLDEPIQEFFKKHSHLQRIPIRLGVKKYNQLLNTPL